MFYGQAKKTLIRAGSVQVYLQVFSYHLRVFSEQGDGLKFKSLNFYALLSLSKPSFQEWAAGMSGLCSSQVQIPWSKYHYSSFSWY
jgi:hypothetical protein